MDQQFHCNTCNLAFRGRDAMVAHYSGAMHTENVKRRVAGLVPLTAQAHGARSTRAATSVQTTSYKCTICDKRFATPQTLSSHLQSKMHREKKAKLKAEKELEELKKAMAEEEEEEVEEAEEEAEEIDTSAEVELMAQEEEWTATATRKKESEDLDEFDCLFSSYTAPTPEDALCHMAKTYNFTLPLADKVIDVPGLLRYLARKVNGGLCLCCDKVKDTRAGIQQHMISVGHCMIKLGEGEYAEFYDKSVPFQQGSTPAGAKAVGHTLVLPSGATLVSKQEKKDHQAPVQYRDPNADKEPLMIAAKKEEQRKNAHMTVLQMNRYTELLKAREAMGKKHERMDRNHVRQVNKQRMRLGVHLNNQHGKGYQGDYVGKTI
eukprot:TRINITY_DN20856_c0_g1_i1.p1 TRINITY_DN20856_c0_g1~~TRINITY_DN20856_c0_g1_i1.p1  ORF type:complete len:377 (+),score=191.21 TRINITY_DN20856_c0_g1_i1:65-1195(+)